MKGENAGMCYIKGNWGGRTAGDEEERVSHLPTAQNGPRHPEEEDVVVKEGSGTLPWHFSSLHKGIY